MAGNSLPLHLLHFLQDVYVHDVFCLELTGFSLNVSLDCTKTYHKIDYLNCFLSSKVHDREYLKLKLRKDSLEEFK